MSGFSALLSIDTAALDAQIAVTVEVDAASTGLGTTNALALLGEAGELIEKISEIASSGDGIAGAVLEGLDVLGQVVPFADIEELDEALEVLRSLKERLEPLREMAGLDPSALMNRALFDAGGLDGLIQGLASQVADTFSAEIPAALDIPMGALRDLAGGTPVSGIEMASFASRFMLGLDLEKLRGPFELLDGLRLQATAGGGDLTTLEARIDTLTQRVQTVSNGLVSRAPDMNAIIADLDEMRGEITLLFDTELPGVIDRLAGDIAAIDVEGKVRDLDLSLAPLAARVPVPPRGVGDVFLPPLRALSSGIDSITVDAFTGLLDAVEAEIREAFESSGVGRLRDDLRAMMGGLVIFVRQLPLRSLQLRLTQALLNMQEEIANLADFSPVATLGAQLSELARAIDDVDLDAVRENVDELKAQLEEAIGNFPIEEIRDELAGVVGTAADAVADVPPLLEDLAQSIDALRNEIVSIDLSGAGDQGVNLVKELREHLQAALSNADLPDAVKAPIGILAGEVRKIKLSDSLKGPLTEIETKIDVSEVLAPVQEAIDEGRAALLKLSPTAMVRQLDVPFDQLLAAAEQISPEALIGQLGSSFENAVGQLDRIDPAALVEPLQDQFDDVIGELRALADPAPLLAPLHTAYDELVEILDAIDPTKLFGAVAGQISKLPSTLSKTTTGMIDNAIGPSAGFAVEPGAEALKFGDIVRPFALLVAEARAVLHRGTDDVIEEGLELVSDPLAMLYKAGNVAGSHVSDIGKAMDARRGVVDPLAKDGPMPRLHQALARLNRIEVGLSEGGRSTAELHASVGNVQLDLHIIASFTDRQRLIDAISGVRTGLSAPTLGRSFQALGQVLSGFAPASLLLPDPQASVHERLDALIDVIDPASIADEMDAIGGQLQAKLEEFATDIAAALFKIWNSVFEELEPVMPGTLITVLTDALDAVRAQLAVLDPAQIEAELNGVLDAVVSSLSAFSPAAVAGTLTGSFDAIKSKLNELEPAAMLGDLDPLEQVLAELRKLRPSEILAPLTAQASAIDEALENVVDLDPVAVVEEAIANLKLQIELVLEKIEAEIDELLRDLEEAGGGDGSVSISGSVSVS